MALPGTQGWQLADPLTHWYPQLELPRAAGLRPTFLVPILPGLSLPLKFRSFQPALTSLPSPAPVPGHRQVVRTCLFSEDGRDEPGTSMEPRVSLGWYWRGAASSS
jgi:hypothetical protein